MSGMSTIVWTIRRTIAILELLRLTAEEHPFTYEMAVECLEKVARNDLFAIDALIDLLDRTMMNEVVAPHCWR